MRKESESVEKSLRKICRREEKAARKLFFSEQKEKAVGVISDKIPQKALNTLYAAFEKGFALVFTKGGDWIEKSCRPQKIQEQYVQNRMALHAGITAKKLRRFDEKSRRSGRMTQGAMGLSGAALGLLGIGLPEIPVLIAQILRLANQTCISYGFDPSNENERIFMLGILCTAVSEGEQYASYSALTDRIGRQIDLEKTCERSLAKMIPEASKCICDRLAVSKVIQGVPIVGVVGGVVNFQLTGKIGRIAATKYKKRFLQKLL